MSEGDVLQHSQSVFYLEGCGWIFYHEGVVWAVLETELGWRARIVPVTTAALMQGVLEVYPPRHATDIRRIACVGAGRYFVDRYALELLDDAMKGPLSGLPRPPELSGRVGSRRMRSVLTLRTSLLGAGQTATSLRQHFNLPSPQAMFADARSLAPTYGFELPEHITDNEPPQVVDVSLDMGGV